MKVKIEKLSEDAIKARGIRSWPIWKKEVSKFDWSYDGVEECLILAGRAKISSSGETVEIKAGDFVTFPKGMDCVWEITEPIRKHYNFPD